MSQPWQTGIFDLTQDLKTTLIGWIAPCYLFGRNANQVSGSSTIGMCIGYVCLASCCLTCVLHKSKRQALRYTYNLQEKPNDLLASCVLSSCSNCQEAREMQMRGVPPGGRIPVGSQPR